MNQNKLTVVLIVSSIFLLLVLQLFWLRGSYHNELAALERDAHILFRNTVVELNDSLMQKNIRYVEPGEEFYGHSNDSSGRHRRKKIITDSVRIITQHGRNSQNGFSDSTQNIQVYFYSGKNKDTLRNFLPPLISHMRRNSGEQRFTINLTGDSLGAQEVKRKFQQALKQSGIDLPLTFITIKRVHPLQMDKDPATLMIVTPSGGFQAQLSDLNWIVLKKITPQIAFSVFLTLLTLGSFIIMFRSIRAQQRLMTLKNDFISNITHELKTPISTVSVALEALKNFTNADNPVRTAEYLDIAQQELSRLTLLTDKVLTTSLFDERGVKIDYEKTNLETTINEILTSLKLVFEKHHADVEVRKQGEDFILNDGSLHLTNVIYNLLDNALKYSPGQPVLTIILEDLGTDVAFTIKDKGLGISAEFHKKIFEKFFRVSTGDVHNIKGYGLGLSYVESVVKGHNGSIEVASSPGEGSSFRIVIPKSISH